MKVTILVFSQLPNEPRLVPNFDDATVEAIRNELECQYGPLEEDPRHGFPSFDVHEVELGDATWTAGG